jgi:tetratricopeptide (TPR) repeat protein
LLSVYEKLPAPVLICLIVLAFFSPVLKNGFVDWDDVQYVLSNPALRGSWLDALLYSPGYYHPLTTLTYKAEFLLFGLEPLPYHFTNLALHLLNCASAFYLLTALGARRQSAFLGALLFGLHPVHVEPAAWISGRKELLWGFFSALTLIFYFKFAGTRSKKPLVFSLVFFILAVLSKPFAAVLPAVILLADLYRGRAFNFRLLLEKTPYLLIAAALLSVSAATSNFLLKSPGGAFNLFDGAAAIVRNAAFYAQKLLLPVNLSALYPAPELSGNTVLWLICLLAALLAGRRLAKTASRAPLPAKSSAEGSPEAESEKETEGPGFVKKLIFGLGFFLITIFPALLVAPPADRYAYFPALGLFFLYGEFILWLYAAAGRPGRAAGHSLLKPALVLAVTCHFFILGLASAQRTLVWKDSLTMWNDVIRKYPLEYLAHYGRGNAWSAAGEYDKALRDFSRCLELSPRYWKAFNNRARLFADAKEFDKAIADYGSAISLAPAEPRLFLNRGNAYFLKGNVVRAVEDYDRALAIAPGFAPALENKRRAEAPALNKARGLQQRRASGGR